MEFQVPFIMIIGAPSMATRSQPYAGNGVLYDDVWDPSVLSRFTPALNMEEAHCPILGAQQGFSRAAKFKLGMFHLLTDTEPLLFPEGKLL